MKLLQTLPQRALGIQVRYRLVQLKPPSPALRQQKVLLLLPPRRWLSWRVVIDKLPPLKIPLNHLPLSTYGSFCHRKITQSHSEMTASSVAVATAVMALGWWYEKMIG